MYMKKYIIKSLRIITILYLLSACEYLDVVPDNIATLDDAFDDESSAEDYLFTCYSWMPNLSSFTRNPTFYGGDEAYRNETLIPDGALSGGYSAFIGSSILRGAQSPTNPIMNYWSNTETGINLHVGIRDCNTFLENIDKVEIIDEFLKKRWIAEVKFLKAYYHFYLFRMYGPIVISDFNLPIDADITEIQKSRSTVDECATYIADLFLEASEDLPAIIEDRVTDLGRATKSAALALRARMLTYAASPLYNGNGDYASVINKDGTSLFPQSFDNNKWRVAAEACQLAITTIEGSGVQLYKFQATDLDKTPLNVSPDEVPEEIINVLTIQQSLSERWTDEKLFVSNNGNTDQLQRHAMAVTTNITSGQQNRAGAFGIYSPTLRIAEMFYTKRGVPIDEDKDWDFAQRYELRRYDVDTDEDFDGNGVEDNRYFVKDNQTTINLHYDRETRFYGSLGFDRGIWFTEVTANGNGLSAFESHYLKARNSAGEYSGPLVLSNGLGSQTGYFAKKLTHYKNTVTVQSGGAARLTSFRYQFPEIRLADLYLLYAECLNEIDDRGTAHVYIDKVRERANLDGVVSSWAQYSTKPNKPNTKDGLRSIIQQERMIELVFEGQRFWDLRRWKLAERELSKPLRGWNFNGKTAEEYYESPRGLITPQFSFRDNLWPIEIDEIQSNPNTVQNGGW